MATRHLNGHAAVAAVAYYRMSSDKQEASIAEQRAEVERMAERRGYKITGEFIDEGISGDDTGRRKQFQRMIADAERGGFKAILCWDQDRFGRFDSIEAGRWIYPLRQAGVHLETVAQGKIDWADFASRMIYGITQEAKNAFLRDLSRNATRGHLAKAKQGLWQGGVPPFGYVVEDQRLVVDAEPAAVVRRIFDDYTTKGRSLRQIAEQLNVEGVPSPRGKQWRLALVRRILTGDVYRGAFVYGKKACGKYHHARAGEIVEGPWRRRDHDDATAPMKIENAHEAIIDGNTFGRCQRMLRERQRDTSPYSAKGGRYVLGGLCRCGNCGHAMSGWTRAGREDARRQYICTGYHEGGKTVCRRNPVYEDTLLAVIVAKIEDKYLSPKNLDRLRAALRRRLSDKTPKADSAKVLAKRLADINRKIDDGAERLLTAPTDLIDVLAAKLRGWKAERDEVQRQVDAARSRPRETPQTVEATIDRCIDRLRGLRENLHAVDREQLRTALREIVEEIELDFHEVPYGQRTKTELAGGIIRLRADNVSTLLPHDSTSAQ